MHNPARLSIKEKCQQRDNDKETGHHKAGLQIFALKVEFNFFHNLIF